MSYDRQCSSCGGICGRGGCERKNIKPEQEPVAWMMVNEEHGHTPTLHWNPQEDWHITWKAVPLYTAPPARQPLTDEKLWEMWVESPSDVLRFARAIERAHGITE